MSNTKEQAFPFMERVWCTDTDQYVLGESTQGMDLRDYFAAKAIGYAFVQWSTYSRSAEEAYKISDAMLEARK